MLSFSSSLLSPSVTSGLRFYWETPWYDKVHGVFLIPRKVRQILGLTYGNNPTQNDNSGFMAKRSQWVSPLTIDCVPVHKLLWCSANRLLALVQPGAFIRAYGTISGSNSSPKGMIITNHPAELFTHRAGCSFSHLELEAGGFAPITW